MSLQFTPINTDKVFEEARHFHTLTPAQQSLHSQLRMIEEIEAFDNGWKPSFIPPEQVGDFMAAANAGIEAATGKRIDGTSNRRVFHFPINPLGKDRMQERDEITKDMQIELEEARELYRAKGGWFTRDSH